MLNIITGQPGDGKTLYTISSVRDYKKECDESKDTKLHGRQVFYHGIAGVNPSLGWQELKEVSKWFELPHGSIIIIDEAQETFPPQKQGSTRPEHYRKFATHRHHGFDIYLITQNAMNIDFRVRSMCNVHWHVSRNFGRESATIYRFKEVQNPRDYHAKKEAIKKQWNYPKEVYDLYKSAEVHTHKPRLPWRQLIIYGGIFAAFPVMLYVLYLQFRPPPLASEQPQDNNTTNPVTAAQNQIAGYTGVVRSQPQQFDPTQYQAVYKDIPYSAPAYQHLLRVKVAPMIDGCAEMRFGKTYQCNCNDQQGNRVFVSAGVCKQYIQHGVFNPYQSDIDNTSRLRRPDADIARPGAANTSDR